MEQNFGTHYLKDAVLQFHKLKSLGDKAMIQVADEEFFARLDGESNSIALIVKHVAGNSRSRWMDFLTSDGEKPDRNRDSEFVIEPGDTRARLMERWEGGWNFLFQALDPLTGDDLGRSVLIRGEPHTVTQAINRQLTHYANHVGQIVLLAKHFRSAQWKTLSIPRGKSAEFNARMVARQKGSAC